MLLVAPVLEEHRIAISDEQRATMATDPDLRNRVNIPRSTTARASRRWTRGAIPGCGSC